MWENLDLKQELKTEKNIGWLIKGKIILKEK